MLSAVGEEDELLNLGEKKKKKKKKQTTEVVVRANCTKKSAVRTTHSANPSRCPYQLEMCRKMPSLRQQQEQLKKRRSYLSLA